MERIHQAFVACLLHMKMSSLLHDGQPAAGDHAFSYTWRSRVSRRLQQRDQGRFAVIVEFIDNVTGAAVYINPAYVVSLRPDPADPADVTLVKLEDGETIRVRGNHKEVADKLTSRPT